MSPPLSSCWPGEWWECEAVDMSSDPLPSLASQLWSPTLRLAQVRLLRLTDRAPRVPPRGRLPRERSPLAKGSERVAQGSPKSSLLLLHCQPASPPFLFSLHPSSLGLHPQLGVNRLGSARPKILQEASKLGSRRRPAEAEAAAHSYLRFETHGKSEKLNWPHIFQRTLCWSLTIMFVVHGHRPKWF